ncbi:hypothetical protein [Novosphingobium ginsenosidimutans]|uniref:Uncharacterized protein n=1 Tax=Novosphingobium ginsenosidimutans TaxID=1176536 RepID=A0A5B8S1J5_9SPHN|nr:hypothetical protein [Novosphingobium ginsenosidimutans]QEA14994.1 hypothetical protein FRF71_01950 [Novosphingobium ginsenosidimutans]
MGCGQAELCFIQLEEQIFGCLDNVALHESCVASVSNMIAMRRCHSKSSRKCRRAKLQAFAQQPEKNYWSTQMLARRRFLSSSFSHQVGGITRAADALIPDKPSISLFGSTSATSQDNNCEDGVPADRKRAINCVQPLSDMKFAGL